MPWQSRRPPPRPVRAAPFPPQPHVDPAAGPRLRTIGTTSSVMKCRPAGPYPCVIEAGDTSVRITAASLAEPAQRVPEFVALPRARQDRATGDGLLRSGRHAAAPASSSAIAAARPGSDRVDAPRGGAVRADRRHRARARTTVRTAREAERERSPPAPIGIRPAGSSRPGSAPPETTGRRRAQGVSMWPAVITTSCARGGPAKDQPVVAYSDDEFIDGHGMSGFAGRQLTPKRSRACAR